MKKSYVITSIMRSCWKHSRRYVFASVFSGLLNAVLPFVAVFAPKLILDELLGLKRLDVLGIIVLLAVTIPFMLSFLISILDRIVTVESSNVVNSMYREISKIVMTIEYSHLEDPKFIDLTHRAIGVATHREINDIIISVPVILSSLFTLLGTLAILISFNINLVLIMLGIIVVNTLIQKYFQKKTVHQSLKGVDLNKTFNYFIRLMRDVKVNKEIRLFGAVDFLMNKSKQVDDLMFKKIVREEFKNLHLYGAVSVLTSIIQTAITYGYVGYQTIINQFSIGTFTMTISAASTFDSSLRKIMESLLVIDRSSEMLEAFVQLSEMKIDELDSGLPFNVDEKLQITFENVSFKYPNSDRLILKNIDLTITEGQRISIVGRNGAGKTTFIKLLSRLYKPTEGRILMNGVDINEISQSTYLKLLSIVFQDYKLFELSAHDNVALKDGNSNTEKVQKSIEQAGLGSFFASQPNGINTNLGRWYDPKGIELSGGTAQKLAIARTIYKDSKIIILDEPTAALDPLAEAEVYEKFNDIVIKDKTAIYISHRLSSSKFCHVILVVEDGIIKEKGNHQELIDLNGSYAELFKLQQEQFER